MTVSPGIHVEDRFHFPRGNRLVSSLDVTFCRPMGVSGWDVSSLLLPEEVCPCR